MATDQVSRGHEVPTPRPSGLARAADVVVSALEVFCTILMVGMAVIVLTGVWYRYVVQRALPWYDEFAEFLLVWLTFYGSALA
ncbi:MAG: TRAP transporter small permease, partial [Armatimonadota bacterium]